MVVNFIEGKGTYNESLGISNERCREIEEQMTIITSQVMDGGSFDASKVFRQFLEIAKTKEELALVSYNYGDFHRYIITNYDSEKPAEEQAVELDEGVLDAFKELFKNKGQA